MLTAYLFRYNMLLVHVLRVYQNIFASPKGSEYQLIVYVAFVLIRNYFKWLAVFFSVNLGTEDERGVRKWRKLSNNVADEKTVQSEDTYDLPYIMGCLRRQKWATYIPFLPTFRVRPGLKSRLCSCCKKSKEK